MARRWKSTDPYPKGATFGELLDWHLTVWGTNPNASKEKRDRPWVLRNFAAALRIGLPDGQDENGPEKNLRNWRSDTYQPNPKDDRRIFEVLFGGNPELADWNADLQNALDSAREAKRRQAARVSSSTVADSRIVPRPTAHFMGRDDEVGVIASVLASAEHSAVLIQGGPGIGKSEITKAVAHHDAVAARFGERRYFVPLEAAATAGAMQDAIIRAIGGDPTDGFNSALQRLSGNNTLLLLDNLETPWGHRDQQQATEQVLTQMSAISGLFVVASFRGYVTVDGLRWERHWVDPLPTEIAADLFASIAGRWVSDDSHLSDFIAALGGVPLAINLVARRANPSTLGPLWREWRKNGVELAKRPNLEADRLTSLAFSIELSLAPLRSGESNHHQAFELLACLGHLPAGMNPTDAKALMGEAMFEAVERLRMAGLLSDSSYIRLLPPVREHVRRNVEVTSTTDWAQHFAEMPRRIQSAIFGLHELSFDARLCRVDELMCVFEREIPNIESAFRYKVATNRTDDIRECLDGLFWMMRGLDEETTLFTELAEMWQYSGELALAARCWDAASDNAKALKNLSRSAEYLCKALELFRQVDDKAGEVGCLYSAGTLAAERSDYQAARDSYKSALSIALAIDDRGWANLCKNALANALANATLIS